MPITAIQDRLEIRLSDALVWLGFGLNFETVTVNVLDNPPATTTVWLKIDRELVSYTTGASPTTLTVAAGLVSAINLAIANVTAVDNLDGTYTLTHDVVGSEFELVLDTEQDIVSSNYEIDLLDSLITVAKTMADNYCNNPFYVHDDHGVRIDSLGNQIVPDKYGEYSESQEALFVDDTIPDAVRKGVLQILRFLWNDYIASSSSSGGTGFVSTGVVKGEKARNASITYGSIGDIVSVDSPTSIGANELPNIAKAILLQYKISPGI